MQTIDENFFNCRIRLLNLEGSPKLYEVKHNETKMELHLPNLAEAFRAAKLLDLDCRVCTWFSSVY